MVSITNAYGIVEKNIILQQKNSFKTSRASSTLSNGRIAKQTETHAAHTIIVVSAISKLNIRARGHIMRSMPNQKANSQKRNEFTLNIEYSRLALRLRTLRMAKNLTVEQVAAECNISADDLYAYERDKKVPIPSVLDKLYQYYGA